MLSMALCQHSFVGSQQQIKQDTLISALIGINNHSTVGKPEKKEEKKSSFQQELLGVTGRDMMNGFIYHWLLVINLWAGAEYPNN